MISIEPHYLPSLEYFTILGQTKTIEWDLDSPFKKQTFRNRCYILGSNKTIALIVPVHYHHGMPYREAKIDYGQSWVRAHWGAISSAYGKAPFYEYFASEFHLVINSKPNRLIDLNHAMLSVCLKMLQWEIEMPTNHPKKASQNLRDAISPKQPFESREFYLPISYQQNFGNTFVPNLSILDILFCQGPASGEILKNSIKTPIEPFVD